MSRITLVNKPGDYPGMAILAQNPKPALLVSRLAAFYVIL